MNKPLRLKVQNRFKFLVIIFLSFAVSAQLREPSNNEERFLELRGTILGVKSLKIICNKHFPQYLEQNEVAYNTWEEKFNKYLVEVKRQFSLWITVQANKEKKQESEIIKIVDNYMMDGQNQSEKKRLKEYENFNNSCKSYPEYLESQFTDIKLIIENYKN